MFNIAKIISFDMWLQSKSAIYVKLSEKCKGCIYDMLACQPLILLVVARFQHIHDTSLHGYTSLGSAFILSLLH
jgi:hypothetical protein